MILKSSNSEESQLRKARQLKSKQRFRRSYCVKQTRKATHR